MTYIQRKDKKGVTTVDSARTLKQARRLKAYHVHAETCLDTKYYLSSNSCSNWGK